MRMLHLEECSLGMKRILQLKNSHTGEHCFIVGTGASLRYEDLEAIKKEYSFSSNSIFLTYPNTSWRPDCYMKSKGQGSSSFN